ncbi:sushi, von Willebrand factor type A, EGF and pentraxin domain-containing protein 1-like [Dreissena polymorpha]|uniref:sushi, von Willebrand factor type A, EGF and pentraxin domain-containing protein 1-like n=1 Tax=Dreissena polymorpha TaxID=45954 RepID=UPI002263C7FC|nr:sushi, von Willebrand factor type A, EGF and pentraxin domain-containing protein 1-like [Dreissena polymorpha]
MHGKNSTTCLESGKWEILKAICTIKDCHSPPVLQNGHYIVSKTTYNSTVTYKCNAGHELHGKNFITCLQNGKWEIPVAICTIKGYEMHGNNSSTCLENGIWEILEANCTNKDCQDPPVLQNGFHDATTTTYNSTVMYSCNPGFIMFGESSITCLDTGNWSELLVNCTIKDCHSPPVMHNGNLTVSTTTYNSTAIYTCSSGYDIHGPNSIRCLATGDWDKLEAKCTIKDCQDPPVLQNGFHNATTTTYNSTAIYSCNPGYTKFGENSITCLDTGNWSKLLVNCTIKDCATPPALTNGGFTSHNTIFNSTVEYTCNHGYELIGMSTIRCLETGNWNSLETHCTLKNCHSPPVLQYGYSNVSKTTYNSTVIYTCSSGYDMHGPNSITCLETGYWDKLEAKCTIKDCGAPPELTNGDRTFHNTTVNSTVQYMCNPGYDLIGMSTISCLESGTWNSLEANCTIKNCPDPPVLQHGFHAATTTTYTSTVKYSCNPGYTMFGECSITCLDTGNWSELLVNCTIKGKIHE